MRRATSVTDDSTYPCDSVDNDVDGQEHGEDQEADVDCHLEAGQVEGGKRERRVVEHGDGSNKDRRNEDDVDRLVPSKVFKQLSYTGL